METRGSYVQGDAKGPTALLPYSRKVLGRHLTGSRKQQGPKWLGQADPIRKAKCCEWAVWHPEYVLSGNGYVEVATA